VAAAIEASRLEQITQLRSTTLRIAYEQHLTKRVGTVTLGPPG
jgi:hypothetical protein